MKTSEFSLQAECFGIPLQLIVRFNNQVIFNQLLSEPVTISHEFEDSAQLHIVELELAGKLPEHTVLNSAGKIVKDCIVEITEINLAGIDITPIFLTASEYTHDFNGTEQIGVHDFYGPMGCNGIVRFEFEGPVYRWLLESL